MPTMNSSIPVMVNLLQELHTNKEVALDSFHYGDNYKRIAEDLYKTVKSIGGYGVSLNEDGLRTVIAIK
ncbi:hypothetical protein [Paenibacillus xylanexedens]|uniref:hypothetical protein n=1 Tax=Paenibacillus xylanexedens TaxID=528191 RepID=UPI000F542503|nr:hypothetical protein [Paenibacillus xylanexedens]RPK31814.1 hypothetical protein EDO6_02441 [Paenibacillus xylanexedens]